MDLEKRSQDLEKAKNSLRHKWFDDIDQICSSYINDEDFLKLKIESLRVQNNLPQAIQTINVFLKNKPMSSWALTARGGILIDMKQDGLAESVLMESLRIEPSNAMTYFYLGTIQQKINKLDLSNEYFTKSLSVDGTAWFAFGHRAMNRWQQNRVVEALDDINAAINLNPFYVLAYELKTDIFFHQNKITEALNVIEQLIQFDPDDGRHYFRRGSILIELQRLEEAKRDFETALSKGVTAAKQIIHEQGWN